MDGPRLLDEEAASQPARVTEDDTQAIDEESIEREIAAFEVRQILIRQNHPRL